MTSIEFITTSLERICEMDSSSCRDFINFSRQLGDFPPAARTIVTHIADTPDDDGCKLLSGLIKYWVKSAAEKFPKTTARLPNAEKLFQQGLYTNKKHFVKEWMKQYECLGIDIPNVKNNIPRRKFGSLGLFLHNVLFMEWSHSSIDNKRPQVSFPEECLVGKYAWPVIYYVAGWILYSAS